MWGVQSTVSCQNLPCLWQPDCYNVDMGNQEKAENISWEGGIPAAATTPRKAKMSKVRLYRCFVPAEIKGTEWRRRWKCDGGTWNTAGVNRSHISAFFAFSKTPQQLASLITSPSLDEGVLMSELYSVEHRRVLDSRGFSTCVQSYVNISLSHGMGSGKSLELDYSFLNPFHSTLLTWKISYLSYKVAYMHNTLYDTCWFHNLFWLVTSFLNRHPSK